MLRQLSEQFELCAFGLSQVRQEWETADVVPGAGSSRKLIS